MSRDVLIDLHLAGIIDFEMISEEEEKLYENQEKPHNWFQGKDGYWYLIRDDLTDAEISAYIGIKQYKCLRFVKNFIIISLICSALLVIFNMHMFAQ